MTHLLSHQQRPSKEGGAWIFHIYGLSCLAFALPILDVLARNAEFFVARRSGPLEIATLAALLVFGPGSVLIVPIGGLELAARALDSPFLSKLSKLTINATVGALTALLFLVGLTRSGLVDGWAWIACGLAAGLAFWWAYSTVATVRRLTINSALALLAVPAVFFCYPDIHKIVFLEAGGLLRSTGARTPVIFILFDELSVTALLDANRQIDPLYFPNLANLAKDATWFPNAISVSDTTELAVPAILSGRLPSVDRLPILGDYPDNLFTALGGDYEVFSIEPLTRLCPLELNKAESVSTGAADRSRSLFSDLWVLYQHLLLPPSYSGHVPIISDRWKDFAEPQVDSQPVPGPDKPPMATADDFVREAIVALGRDRGIDLQRFLDALDTDQESTLSFLHVLLPHVPWEFLPSGARYPTRRDRIPGLARSRWLPDESFVIQAYRRYLLQLRFVDSWIGELVDRLEELGMYDRSLLVLTADHGVSFRPGDLRRLLTVTNSHDLLPVPLLIKQPGPKGHGSTFEAQVATIDILPTVLDTLGVEPDWPIDGRSVFSAEGPTPIRSVDGKYRQIELSADIHIKKYETLDWKLATFGSADDPGDLWRSGNRPALYGLEIDALERMEGTGISARFRDEFLYLGYDPQGTISPALISGSISMTDPDSSCCELAVAVNGVIEATVHTHGSTETGLRFSAFVREGAFTAGDNVVEVLRIGEGTRPPLELLASTLRDYSLIQDPEKGVAAIRVGERAIPIKADAMSGYLETVALSDELQLSGWAVEIATGAPPLQILVFGDGRLIYGGITEHPRHDVSEAKGLDKGTAVGFRFEVPITRLASGQAPADLRVFALSDVVASELVSLVTKY